MCSIKFKSYLFTTNLNFHVIKCLYILFTNNNVYICFRIAGHPLAQNERCLHIFLQEPVIDKSYVPGKIRNT